MKIGLDSAYPPSVPQIAAAKAAGYGSWSGYFSGPGILNGWTEQNFDDVQAGGLETSAYCSGWADPVAMKTQAVSWGVPRIILDDESGIRSLEMDPTKRFPFSQNRYMARKMLHGGEARPVLEMINGVWTVSAWVQPWLTAAGSGQYGNEPVFAGVSASCYVFAAYLGGDPGASWPSYYARPAGGHPCGWQFQGTHVFSGIGVDSTNYDDSFFGGEIMIEAIREFYIQLCWLATTGHTALTAAILANGDGKGRVGYNQVAADGSNLRQIIAEFASMPDAFQDKNVGGVVTKNLLVAALTALPVPGLSKTQVDAEILTALGNLPKPPPGGPHHHGVLGIINTGPVVPD